MGKQNNSQFEDNNILFHFKPGKYRAALPSIAEGGSSTSASLKGIDRDEYIIRTVAAEQEQQERKNKLRSPDAQ